MKKVIFFIFLLINNSCYVRFPDGINNINNNNTSIKSSVQKEFRKIMSGTRSNIRNYETKIINNEDKFQELLNSNDTNTIGTLYIPKIDFNLKTVLAIYLGDKPSSGYSVDIEKIIEENNELKVYIKEIKPEKGDSVKAEITQPFLIIEISKFDKNITFINNSNQFQETNIPYGILDFGNDSGIKTLSKKVIENEKDFSNLYTEHILGKENITDNKFPKIDFDKYSIACIFLGNRENNGYSIRIDKIIKTNSQIIIKANEVFIKAPDFQEKDSYPYIFIQIEKSDLPIDFDINFIFNDDKNNSVNTDNKKVLFESFLTGNDSLYKDNDYFLIKDNLEFKKVWDKHIGTKFQSLPIIEFGRNSLVAIFLGEKKENGYKIKIDDIIETENDLKIFVEIIFDKEKSRSISVNPYSMFLIPKTSKNASFIIKEN